MSSCSLYNFFPCLAKDESSCFFFPDEEADEGVFDFPLFLDEPICVRKQQQQNTTSTVVAPQAPAASAISASRKKWREKELAQPTATGVATDAVDGFTELNGACGVATFSTSSGQYAIVAAYDDDGVQLIDISDPTTPVAVGAATDGTGGFTELSGASDVEIFVVANIAYAIVAAEGDALPRARHARA